MEIKLYKLNIKGSLRFYKEIGFSEIPDGQEIFKSVDPATGDIRTYNYDKNFSKEVGHPAYVLQGEDRYFPPLADTVRSGNDTINPQLSGASASPDREPAQDNTGAGN